MTRLTVTLFLVGALASPCIAADGQDVLPLGDQPILRSALAAAERMSQDSTRSGVMTASQQQTKLNNDRRTQMIVISVIAAAVAIYVVHHWMRDGSFSIH